MRVAFLGPEGTFTQEAALHAPGAAVLELVPMPTIYDTIMAVRDGSVERAVVPIENSLEGSVRMTLDTLATEAEDVSIVGEVVLGIEQCLIARERIALSEVEVVISHPQALAQCAQFIREQLPEARAMTSSSTADAVRLASERIRHRWAAIGTAFAANLYGCTVLRSGIEDRSGNETRFVWLAPLGTPPGIPGSEGAADAWKTAIVFWGSGADAPGWLVSCLSELASRDVNLTRIESRPRRHALGHYMFFADLEGRDDDDNVKAALSGLRNHAEVLHVLGSFPTA